MGRAQLESTDALLNERIYLFLNTQRDQILRKSPSKVPHAPGWGGGGQGLLVHYGSSTKGTLF